MSIGLMTIQKQSNVFGLGTLVVSLSMAKRNIHLVFGDSGIEKQNSS